MGSPPKNQLEIIDTQSQIDTSPPRHWTKLSDLVSVRREMGLVYRQAKSGKIDVQDATRLTYILSQIARVLESEELSRRAELIESIMEERKVLR
ncbi:MAG: hypothetical protein ACYCRD_07120 [Leptospirillum sp.]